jgi:amidase
MIQNTPQFNVTGHPAISVPCGVADDLPVGLMVVGRHFDDLTVLQVADAVARSGDWKGFRC